MTPSMSVMPNRTLAGLMATSSISLGTASVIGMAVALCGLVCLFLSRRAVLNDELRHRRRVLWIAGGILGFGLSWVPWPIQHGDADRNDVVTRLWGIPAPVRATLRHGAHTAIAPVLSWLALPMNMACTAGLVAQLGLSAGRRLAKRRRGAPANGGEQDGEEVSAAKSTARGEAGRS